MPDQRGPQLCQGPPPIRQAQCRGRHLSESLYLGFLSRGDTRQWTTSAYVVYRRYAVVAERMEISIDGIGMHVEQMRDVDGSQTRGVEQDGFSPASLAGGKRLFEHCM